MKRVLIADDHEIVRRGLKDLLSDAFGKVKIGEARTAQETLDLAQSQEWDMVLLDINMPGRNGLEVLQDLKRLRPAIPVLVLSVSPEQDYALRALKLGASGYLTKDRTWDELLVAIRKSLAGGRYVTSTLAEKLADHLSGDAAVAPHEVLSNRELQVLQLIASGKTIKEIAAQLSLSEKTIGTYRTRISEKLHLATNVELTRYALQHKLAD